jgi:DNA-binding transcriptional MerR regulator
MSDDTSFCRIAKAAAHCGIPPRTLREWVRRRIVPCYRPTKRMLLFRIADLDSAMDRFRCGRARLD